MKEAQIKQISRNNKIENITMSMNMNKSGRNSNRVSFAKAKNNNSK
jgi:hypothetical protein